VDIEDSRVGDKVVRLKAPLSCQLFGRNGGERGEFTGISSAATFIAFIALSSVTILSILFVLSLLVESRLEVNQKLGGGDEM